MEVLFEGVGGPATKQQPSHSSPRHVDNDIVEDLRLQMRDFEFRFDVLQNARTHDLREDLNTHEARLVTTSAKVERLLAGQRDHDTRLAGFEARLQELAAAVGQPRAQAAVWQQRQDLVPQTTEQAAVWPQRQVEVDSGNAHETLSDLQSKLAEVTHALNEISDMRRNLEHRMVAFDNLEGEVDRLRRTVLLAVDPDVQHDDKDQNVRDKESARASVRAKKSGPTPGKNAWHQALPNLFKAINAEGTGYDPTHAYLEKRYTALTGIGIVICLLVLMIIFSSHTFTEAVKIQSPSLGDYLDIISLDNLLGTPECHCEYPIMTWGNATGFVDGLSYRLDSWCIPQDSGTAATVSMVNYTSYGKTKEVYAVDIPFGLNVGFSEPDLLDAMLLGAYVSSVYDSVRSYLDYGMCPVANNILNKSLNNYLQQFFVSDFLRTQSALIKSVSQEIMGLAYEAGLIFQAGYMTQASIAFLSVSPAQKFVDFMGMVAPSGLPSLVQPCAQITPMPCGFKDPSTAPGTMILQCCIVQDYYRVQCYTHGKPPNNLQSQDKNTCVDQSGIQTQELHCRVLQLPCTEPLRDLSRRLNITEYAAISDGVKAAMLNGMSPAAIAARAINNRAPRSEPDSRRLDTDTKHENLGYLWAYSEASTFSRYYGLCKPHDCQYSIVQDKAYGLFLVFTGMAAGVVSGFKFGCGILAGISRKAAKSGGMIDSASVVG